jgi:hypothetical protein
MPKLSEILFGAKPVEQQIPTMTPEQQQLLTMLTEGMGESGPQMFQYLSELLSGDSQAQSAFAAPMMRQFQEETIPGIAERFGGVGAQSSSGFQQALGKAGAGLQENLAALRSQLQSQAAGQLQGLLGQGLGTRAFENIYMPQQQGLLHGLAGGAGQGAGSAMMSAAMA